MSQGGYGYRPQNNGYLPRGRSAPAYGSQPEGQAYNSYSPAQPGYSPAQPTLQPPRPMDTSPLFGSSITGYNPLAPASPVGAPGAWVGAPGSPEWHASMPDSYRTGTHKPAMPAGADPATFNPDMAALTANNPALAAYARSGLSATSPVFNQPGAIPTQVSNPLSQTGNFADAIARSQVDGQTVGSMSPLARSNSLGMPASGPMAGNPLSRGVNMPASGPMANNQINSASPGMSKGGTGRSF